MTKKHFEAIAHTLNANFADLALVQDFADMCGEFSPRFDRPRFIEAATKNMRQVERSQTARLERELNA